jgi:pyruvate kinase
LHYLALRRHDLRGLQIRLAALGLSSLGRAESHVLATLDAVLAVLNKLVDPSWQPCSQEVAVIDFAKGQQLLSEHTDTVFGPTLIGRGVRVMVTSQARVRMIISWFTTCSNKELTARALIAPMMTLRLGCG